MVDNSITFKTDLDNKQLEKEYAAVVKKIDNLNDKLQQKKSERLPIVEQAEELGVQLDLAKAKLAEMETAQTGAFSARQIADQKEDVASLQARWNAAQTQVERYDSAIQKTQTELERAEGHAGELAAQLCGVGESGVSAFDALTNRLAKFEKRIIGLAKRVFVFSLITMALRNMRTWLGNAVKANSDATAAIARLKGALLTLAQPLVQVVIPAFITLVNVLTQIVTAVASLFAQLSGKTLQQSADAAKALNDEQKALKGVGGAAKKAAKSLAGFDEINKLTANDAGAAGAISDAIKPLFDAIKDYKPPAWLDKLVGKLQLNFRDVFLNWENLTGEQIAKKIIAGLGGLAGGVAGFAIAGVPGAIIGTLTGVTLGLIFDSLIFDNDGQVSKGEIVKMICAVSGALAGGFISFFVGGPGGAAIGVFIGAGLGLHLSSMLFDAEGNPTPYAILKSLIVAAGILAGGIIGFVLGGPLGGAIGVTVGAGVSLMIDAAIFTEGAAGKDLLMNTIITALSVIASGSIGFILGGPGGAVIGVIAGAGIALLLDHAVFSKSSATKGEIMKSIVSALAVIAGGALGFALGGPLGTVIGVSVGAGIGMLIKSALFEKGSRSLKNDILKSLTVALTGILGGLIGFAVGGPVGAAIGASIGVGVTLIAKSVKWSNASTRAIQSAASFDARGGFGGTVSVQSTRSASSNIDTLRIPALAQGAVIPPNREFLAVLGDQTSGNNIEAPEAALQAMADRAAGTNTALLREIIQLMRDGRVLVVNDTAFAELVYRSNNNASRLHGGSLVSVR